MVHDLAPNGAVGCNPGLGGGVGGLDERFLGGAMLHTGRPLRLAESVSRKIKDREMAWLLGFCGVWVWYVWVSY
jgi:hypothetical protein